jgi:EmrB/QacA subfamily drug resistance transporter
MTDRPRAVNRNIILIISTVTAFILPFLVASVNVALPTMGREFGMEAMVMSWVSTSYFLAIAAFQVPFGRLSDILGRRRLFLVGLVVTTGASFLGGFATSVPMLIVSRVLQGAGSGLSFNNSVAILTSVFPGRERAKALGISQSGTYLGLSLGPLIGGVMTEHFGWQSLFLLSGALGVILVLLVFLGLRSEWREARGERFDGIGSIAYVFAMVLFMFGFSELGNLEVLTFVVGNTLVAIPGYAIFLVGTLGMIFFIWWESRVASPVLDLSLFRHNRVFVLSNVAALITYISTFAVTFLLSLYLQYIKAFSAQTAGLTLVSSSVLMTVFTLSSGFISQKVAPRRVATLGMALNAAAVAMFFFLGNGTPLWYVILGLAVYGTGIGLFVSPNTNIIMGSVAPQVLGVAAGTLGTMRTAGMMVSMGIVMILFSLYIGGAEITPARYPDFLESVRTGFIIFTALSLLGLFCQSLARPSPKPLPTA